MMDNGTNTRNSGQDLRRDKRFEVSLAALISQPGHPDVACEIRDFCQGGLFLKFSHPEVAIASLGQRTDSAVEIVFTPNSNQNVQPFRILAKIKRMSPHGVGVVFDRQPIDALRALQKLRMAEHRQRITALPASGAHQLGEACTDLLNDTLLQAHDHLTGLLNDKLHTAAALASGIAEHNGLLSATHEFTNRAATVQTRFVHDVLDALKNSRSEQTTALNDTKNDGLALIDEAHFENWLAASSEVLRLEELFREQLDDIEPRIGQLFNFSCDRSNNPFGPAVITHAYRSVIEDVEVSNRARQVAYTTLREILTHELAPLYAELLVLLPVSQAEITHQQSTHSTPEQGAASTAPVSGSNTQAETAASSTSSIASPTSAPPTKGTLSRLTGSLLDFFRGAMPQAQNSVHSGSAPSQAMSSPGRPESSPSQPGNAAQRPIGTTTRPMMTPPGVAHSPVLQRLSAAGALPPNATPEMQRSVDMFGALFDTMQSERSIIEGTRPMFQQMESSLLRLAMDDPQFLSSPAHPAHKVLNTLDRISMAAGDDGKIADARLLRLMNRWTDRINAEADKNPGVFEEARTQLERVVKPLLNERAARVFRLQEMCEGRQRAEVAKLRILKDLLARMDERKVPNAVIELLNGGWRNVLLIAELRHGVDSQEAAEAWEVLQQLCAWLDPELIEFPVTAEIQGLLQRIDQSLTQVCADKFSQDRIVDHLAAALFDENKSQHQHTSVAARLNDAASEPLSESQDTLVERLRVGDWLQFKSMNAPLNLIWIGDQPPVYVFANYRGIKKLDLKRPDFLQTLESGGAEWTEDMELPLMDRSYSAMIQKMQRDLLWQSAHDPATGLANRKSFFRAIRRNWVRSRTNSSGYTIGVIQLDISNPAGETVGEEIRTPILRDLAQLLPPQLDTHALLARAGESGLSYWSQAADSESAVAHANALQQFITQHPHEIDGTRYQVKAAIGLMWANDCLSPEAYYDNANAACTRARESHATTMLYDSEANDSGVLALAQWAHVLTAILVNNQLSLNCQPVVDAADATRTPIYHEILLHPSSTDEKIATRDLINIAERLQRIAEIDRWVVRKVFQWIRDHTDKLATLGGFSINLSGQSITNPLFLKFILGEFARGDIPGEKIIFEISEIDAIDGHAQTQLFMRQLQRHGCRFTLDEFGAGSSSFTRMKSMKLDYLKIDRSLVREVTSSMIDEALVRSIVETGSFLGIKTVAGYIEDEETLTKLVEMGVDCMQGYLIGEPVALESMV